MPRKILFLADVNSSHTQKLANGLASNGYTIGIFSLTKRDQNSFQWKESVVIYDEDSLPYEVLRASDLKKTAYLGKRRALKKVIKDFQPSIIHAHYATSYGMLGWLSGFHPFIISAWGSDILDFPKGVVKRTLLKKILRSADQLLVTSRTLEVAVKKLVAVQPTVTPFGIDTEKFQPAHVAKEFADNAIVFGVVKSLEKIYNIDVAIRALAELRKTMPANLLIVGDGSERGNLEKLTGELGMTGCVTFIGKVSHDVVQDWHNKADIVLNISQYESFGVSVLEAMACGKPVIVTGTGGLAEIVSDGIEGVHVPVSDVTSTKDAMLKLASDATLRKQMGTAGRNKVVQNFEWKKTVSLVSAIYEKTGGKL